MSEAEAGFGAALFEEAARKSGLLWARVAGGGPDGGPGPARALWHVWDDGAVLVVGDGPGEQPLHGLAGAAGALLTVRSKDKGGRLLTVPAAVARVRPEDAGWAAAAELLKAKRLNAPDHAGITERWARECAVLRLVPDGAPVDEGDGPGAAVPLPTPATTGVPLPRVLGRRARRRAPR